MRIKNCFILIMLTSCMLAAGLPGQGKLYDGPDDPAGDPAAEREGYMTGNRVFLYFQNNCELSDWPRVEVSRWPNDYTGTKMTDGINILVTAQVFLENDTIPVTDPAEIAAKGAQGILDTLWYCETSFRGGMDMDPTGTVEWGLYPVFGYFNNDASNDYPAMSNLSNSWPVDGWPATGNTKKWPGLWNGRYGAGEISADLETFFVANDAHDQEYLENTDTLKYYPRPGVFIGDKKADVTKQAGLPWGGLGVRIETRGYQWNNPMARDVIFWEYNVANISDYDLPQVAFGYHVDNAIGNDSNDELGFFDTYLDLAYSWDIDGVGTGGVKTGTMGFAFLESPGLAYDGIDNDEDGLVDEARDNEAGSIVGPTEGIVDVDQFLTYYRMTADQLRAHYEGDEDQDWLDGFDANGDGKYGMDENPGDDVGLDGMGPTDLNYPGPDEGECNHRPDFREGFGCEPNYNATDVTESDMLGLTSFNLFQVTERLNGQPRTFHADWSMWQLTGTGREEIWEAGISNLIEVFASGPFTLYKGRTERISMACLHSYDDLGALNGTPPSAPVLFEQKKVVQLIYEKDYRFAQPPEMPTLSATAGDGYVALTWNDVADKATREPFLGGINDFEGYKLIRATDKKFQDAQVVTDGNGTPMFYKPIFQCDLKDYKTGFTDFGLLNGMGYDLGDDTGIQHYYVDTNVNNGKTYYYGLIAYDYGIPDSLMAPGVAPSESNLVIELDEFENIRHVGQNVQVVTPRPTALGYQQPRIEIMANSINEAAGSAVPVITSESALKENHVYTLKFAMNVLSDFSRDANGKYFTTGGYEVWDVTGPDSTHRQLIYENLDHNIGDHIVTGNVATDPEEMRKEQYLNIERPIQTDIFDGLQLSLNSHIITSLHGGFDYANSDWTIGNAAIEVLPTPDGTQYYPWDYELVYTGDPNAYTGKSKYSAQMKDENGVKFNKDSVLVYQALPFFMVNKIMHNSGAPYDTLDCVVIDENMNGQVDMTEDRFLFGSLESRGRWQRGILLVKFIEEPQTGDIYFASFIRPLSQVDSLTFKVLPSEGTDTQVIKTDMDQIRVVPNPYVATNTMETVVANWALNQKRRLLFTHLPARCDIKIFTSSGVLVDEIHVDNSENEGIAHWDLVSSEGLEIAAGMYIYHVKALDTDAEKIGKFAVIK